MSEKKEFYKWTQTGRVWSLYGRLFNVRVVETFTYKLNENDQTPIYIIYLNGNYINPGHDGFESLEMAKGYAEGYVCSLVTLDLEALIKDKIEEEK